MKRVLAGLAISAALLPAPARAHLRNYLDTYGYDTLQKGHAEVEAYTDRRKPDHADAFWVNQTELEYGVTDRWTTSLYGVFVDGQGFTALKWENRYRLGEKGVWPVDVTLYGEIKEADDKKDNDELEAKVILAKDWGPWNLAVNPIIEREKETEASGETEWETEKALAVGLSYQHLWKKVTPGVELFIQKDETRITPGLYMDVYPNVRFNVGAGIGVAKEADNFQLKTILELEF
jgi:hypothetical protein